MTLFERFEESELPPRDAFTSQLNAGKEITQK